MNVQGKVLVRDIYVSDKNKAGEVKARPVHYISFVDMETGGDVKLSCDPGHGLTVGQVIQFDAVVKGRVFGTSVGYHIEKIVSKTK